MSIRIYALAKQFNVESKTLVELCKKAGIEGKGSALASLTDEEVELVKPFLQKTADKSGRGEAAPQRPALATPTGKVPVLKRASTPLKPGKTAEPADAETTPPVSEEEDANKKESSVETAAVTTPPDVPEPPTEPASSPATESEAKSAATRKPSPMDAFRKKGGTQQPQEPQEPVRTGLSTPGHAAAVRREDYRSPMRSITDNKQRKQGSDNGERTSSAPTTKGINIRLAPVPKAPAILPSRQTKEVAPQKPVMKLPPEVAKAAAEGKGRPLTDHIQKHEEDQRLKEQEKKDRKKGGKAVVGTAPETEDATKRKPTAKKGRGGEPATTESPFQRKRRPGSGQRRTRFADETDEMAMRPRQLVRKPKVRGVANSTAAPRKNDIVIQLPCTVKEFSEETGISVAQVIRKLIEFGTPLMINSALDHETASLLAEAFDIRADVREEQTLEDTLVTSLFEEPDPPEFLKPRPPVVTFLGHVDHGKTSLLDRILQMDVVSGEKGGITQHIRAYRITTPKGEDITFVDTPGHEAFTEMRARGANCTDIAVLVVAADDGVMPQTEEAISHAKAAGVPIVVALNKIDIPGVNTDKAIQGLATNELIPSEWGGDTEIIRCSALTGEGIENLLDTLLTIAELHELKANPDRPAIGVALEAELRAGEGVVSKLLVQNGTLRTGDVVLCGTAYGRVKAMYDTLDAKKQIDEASPGTPVNMVGLDVAPGAGSKFCVLEDISVARQIAEARATEERKADLLDARPQITLENLFQRLSSDKRVSTLNIIIRADVRGSIEAIKKELGKLEHPEVKIKILQATVGGITEADVQLADASEAIIVGFNVVPDEKARTLAEKKKVQIRRYDIIYNLAADIKAALEGMLRPIEQVKELGRALVQQVFSISRLGNIAGCRVTSGTIERDARIRVIRDSRIIGDYPLDSLKREKDDAKEVREGYECGIKLKGFNDLKEGDTLEAYKIEEIARTF